MTAGLSAANLANKWLDMIRGTAFTAPAASAVKLHTGDPGASGTANASAETDRKALTWGAPANGVMAIVATLPSWTAWDAGSETITHLSLWDHLTAGVFLGSVQLTQGRSIDNGGTLNLLTMTLTMTPIAA